jgi:hypothetical protein
LPQVERDGEAGYFFLDEWNTGRPEVMAATFSLAQDGVIGEYRLPPQWRVIGAGNRVIDRAAAQRMPTPLRNKLSHLFVKVDVDAWVTWAKANNVPPEIIAFIKWRPTLLHIMPAGDENAFPTPRSITRASKYVTAPKEHRQALFAASIGDDVAGEMDGFVRLYESLGDIDDIIAHPDIAKLPEEADIRYAVSVALARKATRQNFSRIVTYADRLPRESKMLIMHEATVLKPDLKNTSAYSEWTLDNKDLILQAS